MRGGQGPPKTMEPMIIIIIMIMTVYWIWKDFQW